MKLNDTTLLRTDAYINGDWVTAPQDRRFAVTNPAVFAHCVGVTVNGDRVAMHEGAKV